MDIVDNNVSVTKYVINNNKRHVSLSNNIACWLKLNINYINEENKSIINKYKKILNQKDINTIIKCTKHNINIVPVMYQLNNNNINLLIDESFKCINICMIKHINNYVKIGYDLLIEQVNIFCWDGYFNVVKYLHKEIGLTQQNFQSNDNYTLLLAYENGRLNVVKYLHKKINLTKGDFQSDDNYSLHWACRNGHLDVVKYSHKEIGLSKENFQSRNNYACRMACSYGYVDVVKYLHQEIRLTRQDFQSDDNYACRWACCNGHITVVKYLHQEIGMTKEDFQSRYNYAYRWACNNGHVDVVEYLKKLTWHKKIYK